MQQQWRIRIRGKQRTVVDVGLVVQAVIALGQQLRDEARAASEQQSVEPTTDASTQEASS